MPAVILYGPPAAGKDAVTKALIERDAEYVLYRRLKVGAGRTGGYRMTTLSHVDALRGAGEIIWENRRYEALYVVDRTSLAGMLRACSPIVHLGQAEAVKAVTAALPATKWVVAWLWCPRDVAAGRLAERGAGDVEARLRAWDEADPLPDADIRLNTAEVNPADAAATIHHRVQALFRTRGEPGE